MRMARVLLVTGVSGMATAMAKLAGSRGDCLFLIASHREDCESLSSQFKGSAFFVANVSNEDGIRNAIKSCVCRCDRSDTVFHVAGFSGRSLGDGPLDECSMVAWHTYLDDCARAGGTFLVCREILQNWMSKLQPGVILNVEASLPAPRAQIFFDEAYAASEGAIESMTQAAASYHVP